MSRVRLKCLLLMTKCVFVGTILLAYREIYVYQKSFYPHESCIISGNHSQYRKQFHEASFLVCIFEHSFVFIAAVRNT